MFELGYGLMKSIVTMLMLKFEVCLILYYYNVDAIVMQARETDSAVPQPFINVAINRSSH